MERTLNSHICSVISCDLETSQSAPSRVKSLSRGLFAHSVSTGSLLSRAFFCSSEIKQNDFTKLSEVISQDTSLFLLSKCCCASSPHYIHTLSGNGGAWACRDEQDVAAVC